MLLTTDEMAERLRVTPATIRRLVRQNRLPGSLRVGGQLRWPSESIDNWIATASKNQPRFVADEVAE